jgi:dihydroorotate dehydrogenase electron transfer subunit
MDFFTAQVLECEDVGGSFSLLRLSGCKSLEKSQPGQFVMLRGAWQRDPILPRAFSILWAEEEKAEFLIHRVGRGSGLLSSVRPGDSIAVLGPLGTSFPSPREGLQDVLVAGGCGIAPLYFIARRALCAGQQAGLELLLGARSESELVFHEALRSRGLSVFTSTEDGSHGHPGLVTELLEQRLSQQAAARILTCGPKAMLLAVREIARRHSLPCYISVEAGMACGLGACLGCAIESRHDSYRYVCQDGPVFEAEEVWP